MSHLFFECRVFSEVWRRCLKWSRYCTMTANNIFSKFYGLISYKKPSSELWQVIWFVGLWSICLSRNDTIFWNKELSVAEVVEHVKIRWDQKQLVSAIHCQTTCSTPWIALEVYYRLLSGMRGCSNIWQTLVYNRILELVHCLHQKGASPNYVNEEDLCREVAFCWSCCMPGVLFFCHVRITHTMGVLLITGVARFASRVIHLCGQQKIK